MATLSINVAKTLHKQLKIDDIQETIKRNKSSWEDKLKKIAASWEEVATKSAHEEGAGLSSYHSIMTQTSQKSVNVLEKRQHADQPMHAYKVLTRDLLALRKASLDRHSAVVKIETESGFQDVRVFLPESIVNPSSGAEETSDVPFDVMDAFARGLDTARSVCEMLMHASERDDEIPSSIDHKPASEVNQNSQDAFGDQHPSYPLQLKRVLRVLNAFKQRMDSFETVYRHQVRDERLLKEVALELALFNGALASLVKGALKLKDNATAIKSINFVRDVIWKRDMTIATCTIEEKRAKAGDKNPNAITTVYRYLDPAKFADLGQNEYLHHQNDKTPELLHQSLPLRPNPTIWGQDNDLVSQQFLHKSLSLQSHATVWGHDSDLTSQPWYQKLTKTMGGIIKSPIEKAHWFDRFMTTNLKAIKENSSTSMSRFTPNPANAFMCWDIFVKQAHVGAPKEVALINQTFRTAIQTPIDAATKSCQAITDFNQAQVLSRDNLKTCLDTYFQNWDGIVDPHQARHEIPILFQTLIGDEVTFTPDQQKMKASPFQGSFIDYKEKATQALREALKKVTILRRTEDGQIFFVPHGRLGEQIYCPESYYVKIDLKLLETNHCINMWSFRARVRNNDYEHSRALIAHFVSLLSEKNQHNLPHFLRDDLNLLLTFLRESDYSFLNDDKSPGKRIQEALGRLIQHAENDEVIPTLGEGVSCQRQTSLSKQVQNNLILAAKSAIELKCLVHETFLGAMRRNIANYTRNHFRKVPILGHLLDWAVRGSMALMALGLKLGVATLMFPVSLPRFIKYFFFRKALAKARHEAILADAMGMRSGGCMSSADRAPELAEQTTALKLGFILAAKVLSIWDSIQDTVSFIRRFGSSRTQHVAAIVSTGVPTTNTGELRGFFSHGVIAALQNCMDFVVSKIFAPFRKGKYKAISVEDYLARPSLSSIESNEIKRMPVPENRFKESSDKRSFVHRPAPLFETDGALVSREERSAAFKISQEESYRPPACLLN